MPDSFIYNPSDGVVILGYVNPGDCLTIEPVQLSLLNWATIDSVGLGGTYGTPQSRREENPEKFLDQNLPVAASMLWLPQNEVWVILDRGKTIQITKAGPVSWAVNTPRGRWYNNCGGVTIIKIKLEPG